MDHSPTPWTNNTLLQSIPNTTQLNQNITTPMCSQKPVWKWSREVLTLLYAIIFVTAIGGNALIIHIVRVRANMKIPFNYLITNMACADILDALVTPAIQIGFMYGWVFPTGALGTILCRLHLYLAVLSISASVLTLTVIAADRYLAIVHTTKTPFTLRAVKRILLAIWLTSGVVFSYDLYRVRLYRLRNGKYTCVLDWGFDRETNRQLDKADMMVKLILLYVIPLVVMAILYAIILMFLWQRKTPGEYSNANQRNIENRKQKVLKMLVTIVILFAVCWFPVHVNHTLIAYHKSTYRCSVPWEVVMVFYMLAHANASINPLLYFIFNKNFRDGLRAVLGRLKAQDSEGERKCNNNSRSTSTRTSTKISPEKQSQQIMYITSLDTCCSTTTGLLHPHKCEGNGRAPSEEKIHYELVVTPL